MSDLLEVLPLRQRKPPRILTDIPLFARCSSDPLSASSSPTNQNTTLGTTPNTGVSQCCFYVLCMHDFESSDPVHLPFHKDEVLTVIKRESSGWWAAIRPQGNHIGWIPSSFVLPLDENKFVEYPNETLALWPYESLNDPPLSALHDPWVPVSEDYAALSFRLATPTDLILYKDFLDDKVRDRSYELFSPSSDERSSDIRDVSVPPTPESPAMTQHPHPPSPFLSQPGAPESTRPTPSLDVRLCYLCPCGMIDQISLLCLTTPADPDETTPQLTSSFDIEDSLVVLESAAASQAGTYSDDRIDGPSRYPGGSADFLPTRLDQGISDTKLLDLISWEPENLAEQLCVLTHALYATIRQNDCLDWIRGRRNTDVTGLRRFFDTHDSIASWVQESIFAYSDATRQMERLDFWIRVAEKCQALRNFDSLCAIILALSGSPLSSLGPAWSRCAHKQTFVMLCNMVDVANQFRRLIDTMGVTMGPSVPFVRKYLEHIKKLRIEQHSNDPPRQLEHTLNVRSSAALCRMQLDAISTLLRHQSSPYDFKIVKLIRSCIDHKLQTVRPFNVDR